MNDNFETLLANDQNDRENKYGADDPIDVKTQQLTKLINQLEESDIDRFISDAQGIIYNRNLIQNELEESHYFPEIDDYDYY